MALEPHEIEKIEKIGEGVTRIDERTKNIKEWLDRHEKEDNERFNQIHTRISNVRKDLSKDATKAGAASGIITVLTAIGAALGAFFGLGK